MERADYEEALTFLLGEGWLLASRYDPRRGGVPFPAWLQGQLAYRLVDHLRGPYGTRKEERFGVGRLAELDRRAADDDGDPLELALAASDRYSEDGGPDEGGGPHAPGDSRLAWEIPRLGRRAPGRAASRARGNGRLAAA